MNTNTTHEHEPHLNSVEGESSLPDTVFHLPSSPPLYARDLEFASMENNTGFKSEPPLTQDADATRPQPKRVSSEETERPPSAQQARDDEDERDNDNDEQEEEADPSDRIVDFDWDDLYYRYQEAVSRCHDEETELMQEWGGLMDYFRIWAESGQKHETNRGDLRLRTRMSYVRNEENTLEQRRNHYITVVKAFESALNLLKANSMGR